MKCKVMIATIGYSTYIVEPEDAVTLLQIAQRCRSVEGYPRKLSETHRPLCDSVSYEEIEFPDKDEDMKYQPSPAPSF